MKKTISGLLALLLVLSMCAGCGNNTDPASGQNDTPNQADHTGSSGADAPVREGRIYTNLLGVDPGETALEWDGRAIPAELYLYWLTSMCSELEYDLNMYSSYYGMFGELLNEDGTAKWDGELEGTPLEQIARQRAETSALSYLILESVAAAHDVALTGEDEAALESDKAAYVERLGGQEAFENNLWEMGISEESFDRVSAVSYLYQHLADLAQDPDSDLYRAPANTDAYVDHILLMTIDSASGEALSEEEIAAKREKAEELLSQLQAADPAELEELFTQLADENSEDTGRETYPDGYFFGPGEMVEAFEEAAFALQPGEISDIVESTYGYHIILRKELKEEHLTAIAEQSLSDYLDEQLINLMEQPEAALSEKLAAIDVGKFYMDYVQAIQALHPELYADTGAEDGGSGEDGTSGSAGAAYDPDAGSATE
ncbi:MAG: hypothetical protein HDT18_01100 [Oscillibacter sp.]|nr:hypothetical protein [Oscillibacter sp.]